MLIISRIRIFPSIIHKNIKNNDFMNVNFCFFLFSRIFNCNTKGKKLSACDSISYFSRCGNYWNILQDRNKLFRHSLLLLKILIIQVYFQSRFCTLESLIQLFPAPHPKAKNIGGRNIKKSSLGFWPQNYSLLNLLDFHCILSGNFWTIT